MNVEVTADYRITSDSMNVIVKRKHIVDPTKSPNWAKMQAEGHNGEPRIEWREVAYCRTLEKALNWIGEQIVRDSQAETVEELLDEIIRYQRQISELVTP